MSGCCHENMPLNKSLQSLTAAALLGQSKWRESREGANWGGGGGYQYGVRASDQGVWGVYGCTFSRRFQWHHRRRYHRFSLKYFLLPQGPASFHGGSNDTIFSRKLSYWAWTYVITWDCTHWPLHAGGRGILEAAVCSWWWPSRAAVTSSESSLPSLVCWFRSTAVRKKVARVPQGRGLIIPENGIKICEKILQFPNRENMWRYCP